MLVHTGCSELPRSQIQQFSIGTLSNLGSFIHAQMTSPCLEWTGRSAAKRAREGVQLGFAFWPRGRSGNVPSPPL